MKVLVIIGNGFDLGHGMLTRFDDFVSTNEVLKEVYSCFENGDNSWNEIESKYKKLISEVVDNTTTYVNVIEELDQIVQDYGFNESRNVNYYDYKSTAFDEEINDAGKIVYLLESFEGEFLSYLRKNYSDSSVQSKIKSKENLQKIFNSATKVINFNYTNVVEEIYHFNQVEHIHGNINDSIIIGCDSFDRLYKSMIDGEYPDINSFEKSKHGLVDKMAYYEYDLNGQLVEREPIKSFFDEMSYEIMKNEEELRKILRERSKDEKEGRKRIVNELSKESYDKVYIIGHSLGKADWSVLDSINIVNKAICYYHDEKDRLEKERIINNRGWKFSLVSDDNLYE